ncbi:MAG: hypothetical protein QF404_06690 [Planctomycetota bacterium]|jgi:hypothetical protein|nr:hypothetical protein [Planctomycetota bacterium]
MEYLARREVGLEPSRDELSWYQEQLILFVAGERHKIREELRGGVDPNDDEDVEFRMAASPEEMEVTDSDLLSIAARR